MLTPPWSRSPLRRNEDPLAGERIVTSMRAFQIEHSCKRRHSRESRRAGLFLLILSDFLCTCRRPADVDFGGDSGRRLISARDSSFEFLRTPGKYQSNGAAAESCARHTGSVNAQHFLGEPNHNIQLLATYFVIITQAPMGFIH